MVEHSNRCERWSLILKKGMLSCNSFLCLKHGQRYKSSCWVEPQQMWVTQANCFCLCDPLCTGPLTDFTALCMQSVPWQQGTHLGSCFPSSLCIHVLNYITGREDTSLPAIITLNEYGWWYFKPTSHKGHGILRRHYYVWLSWRMFLPFIPEENVP